MRYPSVGRPAWTLHLKKIRRAGIPAAAMHARDQFQVFRIDVTSRGVLNELLSYAGGDNSPTTIICLGPITRQVKTRHSNATGDSAMRPRPLRLDRCEARELQFIDVRRGLNASYVHCLGVVLRHQVNHELICRQNVGCGTLEAILPPSTPMTTMGGSCPMTLKKLYGAALTTPASDSVVSHGARESFFTEKDSG